MSRDFFELRTQESKVKAEIVAKYFYAWARIVGPHADRIVYIDLFSGPGRYKDGAVSVPLMILQSAISEDFLRDRLVTIFNDKDENNSQTLSEEVSKLPGIERLRYKPQINNSEVGSEIIQSLEGVKLAPTLFFVDPWGYKGLSLRLINSVLKNWGCDCIFFFNYNRINMGLNNVIVHDHMSALFGEERADQLRRRLERLEAGKRELAIVEEVSEALKDMGGHFVLPFCFRNEAGSRTSHYLIFVSKNKRGYEIMKDVMAKASSLVQQGVPSFAYCAADRTMPLLFELSRPLDELEEMLLYYFAGQTLTMQEIYEKHHVGRRFIKKNYKDALLQLEKKNKITANPAERRKGTFAGHVRVSFAGGRN